MALNRVIVFGADIILSASRLILFISSLMSLDYAVSLLCRKSSIISHIKSLV
jgi:hypothetical protein